MVININNTEDPNNTSKLNFKNISNKNVKFKDNELEKSHTNNKLINPNSLNLNNKSNNHNINNSLNSENSIKTYNEENKNSFEKLKKKTLSNSIREIFYSFNSLTAKNNFNYKGSFIYDPEKNPRLKNETNKSKMIIELYYRKISDYQGDIIEFYFNDITTLFSKVEREKEQNKIRASILAKISHEFKTPLITIIYILKDYIEKRNSILKNLEEKNDLKNNLSINENQKEIKIIDYQTKKSRNSKNESDSDLINLSLEFDNTLKFLENNFQKKRKNNIKELNIIQNSNENELSKLKFFSSNHILSLFKYDNYLNNTIDLSDYMLSLINDIIDFSAFDSNLNLRFQYDYINLKNLLRFCYRILKILINCKGLQNFITPFLYIDENIPEQFYSDEMRIKQVILNLISNSIKFTRNGHIKIFANLKGEKKVEICIEDTGIGIEKKDLKKLFCDFGKLDNPESRNLNKIGNGLGLSICKRIVENLGDRISVESIPNAKTFSILIYKIKNSKRNV